MLMPNIIIRIIFFIFIAWLFTACNPQPEAAELLEQARACMESNPDSALILIDSIFYPEKSLSHKKYMGYLVEKVRAKYKTYQDISEDTLIFEARDYFKQRSERYPTQTILAYFYSGCVYRDQTNFEKAMYNYKEAERYAEKNADRFLQGLVYSNIGDLFSEQGLCIEALKNYQLSETLFLQYPEKQIQTLSAMGNMYLLINQPDSALICFYKALNRSQDINSLNLQYLNLQNLSVAFREKKEYSTSEIYLKRSFEACPDSTELPRYYLNFAKLYTIMGYDDYADYYMERLKSEINKVTDRPLKASLYNFLANQEKGNKNYNLAFEYQKNYNDVLFDIMKERNNESVYKIQQKYDFELQRNIFNEQLRNSEKYIFLLIFAVFSVGLTFMLYTIRQRNKQIEAQEKIETLRSMASSMRKTHDNYQFKMKEQIRQLMLWKFDTVKKVTMLNHTVKNENHQNKLLSKFNEIVYGKNTDEEWESLLEVFEEVNPGVSSDIRQRCPQLTETEYRVFILSYAKLNPKEIAVILDLGYNTVLTKRSSIRKKIGNENTDYGDILLS